MKRKREDDFVIESKRLKTDIQPLNPRQTALISCLREILLSFFKDDTQLLDFFIK